MTTLRQAPSYGLPFDLGLAAASVCSLTCFQETNHSAISVGVTGYLTVLDCLSNLEPPIVSDQRFSFLLGVVPRRAAEMSHRISTGEYNFPPHVLDQAQTEPPPFHVGEQV